MPAAAHPPRYRVADMCAGTGAFSHALASKEKIRKHR